MMKRQSRGWFSRLTLTRGYVAGSRGENVENGFGGAIINVENLALRGDNITDSFALGGTGGNGVGGAGGAGAGGGIYSTGSLVLTNDSLSGNYVHAGSGGDDGAGGAGGNGEGGGIYSAGNVVLANDTLSGNYVYGGQGGAVGLGGAGEGGAGGVGAGGGIYSTGSFGFDQRHVE